MDNEDEEEETCPLCMQPFDETDNSFFACPCNYQVCLFCVHYIMERMNGKCPACRQDYAEGSFRYDALRAQRFRERADSSELTKKAVTKADTSDEMRSPKKSRNAICGLVMQSNLSSKKGEEAAGTSVRFGLCRRMWCTSSD